MASPASNQKQVLRRERHSLESYYGRRLRSVAEKGAHPGRFSLWHIIKQYFSPDAPCSTLAQIKVPQESPILTPESLRPLLAGFTAPFSLEIHQDRSGQIQFQIGFQEQDDECLTALRALFGSHLGLQTLGIEAWNSNSGLSEESLVSYLLPTSSLYPLSFALRWDEADWVSLVLEQMKSFSSGPLLLQLLARPLPQAGQALATDVLAAVSGLGKSLEAFRQELIRQRFGEPLCLFCLRLLGNDQVGLTALTRSLSALSAPFNHFKTVSWCKRQEKKAAQAVLERRSYGSDGFSVISLTELAGLWHPPLKPDYRIERAMVREVATARLPVQSEPGRILGYHTLRGETLPVVLPYSARNNHFCCFGKSQSGKSTALARIAVQDIEAGLGIAIIDQHDLPSRVLPHISQKRWDDVIVISPRLMATRGQMFPLNLFDLGRKDAFAVEFVCETLKEILGRAFTAESIGPRSSYIFDIAVTALLHDPAPRTPYTVLDLSRLLLDKHFRAEVAERLDDEDTREKLLGFDKLPKDSFAAPLNKLQLFSRNSIRPMIAASENGLNTARGNHRSLLDAKPIVLCDLADIPHASAVVIGSMVLALLQLEAFKRNPQEDNEIFHCYVDEAGAFLNLENADLINRAFTETAKFRMSLGLINQSYETIPPTVRKILSTNVAALMYFAMGIGSGDAKIAMAELHDEFSEEELNRLPVGRAALRLGGEIFSIASPDFKNPSVDQSVELIAHSLASKGIAGNSSNDCNPNSSSGIAQNLSPRSETPQTETAHSAEATTTESSHTAEPRSPAGTAQNHKERWAETTLLSVPTAPTAQSKTIKPVDLSKLQGHAKQAAVLRLLAVSGLVPLADLSALFFPDSPDYGRQFFKVMAQEGGLIGFVKLGKRLAYYLGKAGEEELKKQGKDRSNDKKIQPFILPEERLWEHAALVGNIAARFCALAARKGFALEIERESEWRGVRPDLCVRWNDGDTTNDSDPSHSNHANLVLVEADRGTESKATFAKGKLVPYENAFATLHPTSGTRVRLLVVVPDETRGEELRELAREFPCLDEVLRLAVMGAWPVNADITRTPIFHRIAQKGLVWG